MADSYELGNEVSFPRRVVGQTFWAVERLLASQKGLRYRELIMLPISRSEVLWVMSFQGAARICSSCFVNRVIYTAVRQTATAIVKQFAVSSKSLMTNVLQVATVRLNSALCLSLLHTPHRMKEAWQIVIIYQSVLEFLLAHKMKGRNGSLSSQMSVAWA